jgi:hypothetical protein
MARDAQQTGVVAGVIQIGPGGFRIGQQAARFFSGEHLMPQAGQRGELRGAMSGPTGRHVDLLIPAQQGGRPRQIMDFRQTCFKLLQRFHR